MINPNAKLVENLLDKSPMKKTVKKSAQEMQDEILEKMTPAERIKLTSRFSMFLQRLNEQGKYYGVRQAVGHRRKNSR